MSKGWNIALWIVQVLLFIAFGMAGVLKTTMPIAELAKNMTWVPRVSPGMVRFIGISELCGALGMLLPSLTRIMPKLTALAGLGIVAIMVLAAAHHLTHGEAKMVPSTVILGGMAAFVACGRWKKAPLAAR